MKEQNSKEESPSNRVLYLISLNHATNDSSATLLPTLFPIVLVLFRISLFELGILVAAMYITNVICQPITGLYSERIEPRILLPMGIGIMGISMILLIFSTSFASLFFSAILLRVGSSFFHPVGVSTISRSYAGERLDRTMGFQSAFGNFGIFIVFLIAAPIYYKFGWSAPFLLFALVDLVVVIMTISKLGHARPQLMKGNQVGRDVQEKKKKRLFLVSLPVFFLATTFISGASNAAVVNYGNILLEMTGYSVTQANLLIAVWIGFSFFGAFSTGMLTKRFTRLSLLISAYAISAVSIVAFALFAGSYTISPISLAINGFSTATTYPAIYSELSSFLEQRGTEKGPAYGMIFSSQIIGSSIMGFFAGYISGIFGLAFSFVVAMLLLIVAVFFSLSWKGSLSRSSQNELPKVL